MSKYLVFGHQNPDTDAIAAAIAMSYYLERIGEEAEPVALGEPNDETQFALNKFSVEAPRVIKTASNEVEKVALVDHNEPQQSVSDFSAVQVDYVVDHHRINGFETEQPLFYRAEPIGSTCSLLYKMFQEKNIDIPSAIAGLMLSAIISDTLLFKSPTCTQEDIDIASALAQIAEIDTQAYGLELLKAGTNLNSKSDEEVLNSDAKNFELADKQVRIGQVNVIGFDELLERKENLLELMDSAVNASNLDLFLLIATDVIENDSLAFISGPNTAPVEAAFDKEIIDRQINLPGVVSRKKQVVPPLTDALEN